MKRYNKWFIYIIVVSSFCALTILFFSKSQEITKQVYPDGRPTAILRMKSQDLGIVLRYGDAPDGCDAFGAREAIVNKENNLYYLFYDGQGKDGWKACLAVSTDLKNWTKKGAILELGDIGSKDAKSASSPWVIKEGNTWHMFYLGTPNATNNADRVPMFPYFTLKAHSSTLEGEWIKQPEVDPFIPKEKTYYSNTASPGYIVKDSDEYLQYFSASSENEGKVKRTLGIARTKNLNGAWTIDKEPVFPLEEQIENSSLYFEEDNQTWFLFTNHIGVDESGYEYTDAIWVYWSKDLNSWDSTNKAIIVDKSTSGWARGAIGMPTVIAYNDKLAVLYDGVEGVGREHMNRNIGLALLDLPLEVPAN